MDRVGLAAMNFLSVCSGIEAATQAFHPLGWKPVAFSEIEPFPCAVLKHHYPDVPNWGDMTKFQEWPDATVDVLCGGTPCQSFSVAGLRQGLADPRGNLMLTFGAIAARYRPQWLVWENVPGVLSSNGGRDFGAFIGMLGQLGYGVAYRVLDAQYVRTRRFPHAVPQRRRRVFVVGYLGDWRCAAAVLFDRESLSGHPAPGRKAGQGSARGIEFGPSGGGFADVNPTLDARAKDGLVRNKIAGAVLCAETAPCLDASFHDKQGLDNQHINSGGGYSSPFVANPLTARMHKGINTTLDEGQTLISNGGGFDVAHSLRGDGFDASEDGTGRGTPIVPIAIQERAVSENPDNGPQGSGIRQDGAIYTLEARNKVQAVAWSIMPQNSGKDYKARQVDVAQPLMAGGPTGGNQGGDFIQQPAVAFAENQRGELRTSDVSLQLTSGGGKPGQGYPAVMTPWAVRRLTPVECERLQGFPDDFTCIPYRGKPADKCPDGPRYKALGNSWAVNCADWIGERINEVEQWQ